MTMGAGLDCDGDWASSPPDTTQIPAHTDSNSLRMLGSASSIAPTERRAKARRLRLPWWLPDFSQLDRLLDLLEHRVVHGAVLFRGNRQVIEERALGEEDGRHREALGPAQGRRITERHVERRPAGDPRLL